MLKKFLFVFFILFIGLSAFADEYCTITQIFYGNNIHEYSKYRTEPIKERIHHIGHDVFRYWPNGEILRIGDKSVSVNNGRITSIGNKSVKYDIDGKILRIGEDSVSYNNGRITAIGNKSVKYDITGEILRIGEDSVSYEQFKN